MAPTYATGYDDESIKSGSGSGRIDKTGVTTVERAIDTDEIVTIARYRVLGLPKEDELFYTNYDPAARKRLIRKIDIRLVPMLAVLYLISHLDRANIGNAKIEGLAKDLKLNGVQWNIVLSIFFIPYVLFEVPSNILLKKISRPSHYLAVLITCWGVVMMATGFVKNYASLMLTRVLLGVFEAGFFPGAVYLCTAWYMPNELQSRVALFYTASAMSGAFSGLLAAGIAQMKGVAGLNGWQWIFILEGIATIALGIVTWWLLIDSPQHSGGWMTPDEIRYLTIQNFIKDGGKFSAEKPKGVNWHFLKSTVLDYKLYLQAYILMTISACSYGLKFTMPSIVKGMGFTNTAAQLMTVPPYVTGAIAAYVIGRLSDRFYWRMPFIVGPLLCIVTAFSIIYSLAGNTKDHLGVAYFRLILACIGIYPVNPGGSSWTANNLAPSEKRAMGVAFNICVGNIGGIFGSYMYLDKEAPKYPSGYGTSLALGASGAAVALLLEFIYWTSNKKKAKMDEYEITQRYTEHELHNMGDKSPLFRYTL